MPLECSKQKISTTKIEKGSYEGEYKGYRFQVWRTGTSGMSSTVRWWCADIEGIEGYDGHISNMETKTSAVNRVKRRIDHKEE